MPSRLRLPFVRRLALLVVCFALAARPVLAQPPCAAHDGTQSEPTTTEGHAHHAQASGSPESRATHPTPPPIPLPDDCPHSSCDDAAHCAGFAIAITDSTRLALLAAHRSADAYATTLRSAPSAAVDPPPPRR